VQQIRHPAWIPWSRSHLCGGKTEPRETKIIVRPVFACCICVRCTISLKELSAQQDVDRQTIGRSASAEIAGWDGGARWQTADYFEVPNLADNFAIAGDQDSDIALASERTGQGGRDLAKTAHFHEVGKLGGDEQDFG
jgi:hypothetical protein